MIFVTHDRYFLDVIATRIIEIDQGRAFSHPGNYTAYLEAKAIRQQIAEQTERRRQRFLREELEWVRAGVKARGTKSRHRLDQFYEIEGIEAPPEEREMDLLHPAAAGAGQHRRRTGKRRRQRRHAATPRWLFRHLTLTLRPGQCTGIVGRNGVGKTTLLQALPRRHPARPKAPPSIGKRVKVNYIDQTRMQLDGTGIVVGRGGRRQREAACSATSRSARAPICGGFLFNDQRINERVDLLSGGERARLMLAKVLKNGGNLIVLDEPTNDLDLPSLRMLEEALADFDGSVICVSHDRYFLDRICDQIIAFEDDGVIVQPGNYSYYLEKRQAREAAERVQAQAAARARRRPPARPPPPAPAKPRKLTLQGTAANSTASRAPSSPPSKQAETLETRLHDPEFLTKQLRRNPRPDRSTRRRQSRGRPTL